MISKPPYNYGKANGFSLVEVSVAALLIMLGVSGYATLQSEYVVADAKLNLRSLALQIANEKLTDLANFQQLENVGEQVSFQSISDNQGGNIPAGDNNYVTTTELSAQTFNTQWQVTDFYYVDTDFDGYADSWKSAEEPFYPAILPRYAGLKNVKVTISWTNTKGEPEKIAVFGSIAPLLPSQSFQTKYRLSSTQATP